MKAQEVMDELNISRTTLYRYVQKGLIKGTKRSNGFYDYDQKSVHRCRFGATTKPGAYIYTRVTNWTMQTQAKQQAAGLKRKADELGIEVNEVFSDTSTGLDFNEQTELAKLLNLVQTGVVETILVTSKDRLTPWKFSPLFSWLDDQEVTVIEVPELAQNPEEVKQVLQSFFLNIATPYKLNYDLSILNQLTQNYNDGE